MSTLLTQYRSTVGILKAVKRKGQSVNGHRVPLVLTTYSPAFSIISSNASVYINEMLKMSCRLSAKYSPRIASSYRYKRSHLAVLNRYLLINSRSSVLITTSGAPDHARRYFSAGRGDNCGLPLASQSLSVRASMATIFHRRYFAEAGSSALRHCAIKRRDAAEA